uniref:Uncharacterized protein n=1 Tax=Chromera velia CCMP2878 TaxID=1169474 RepID=A0A0G4IBV1_9ALVE|eukprot:Cvel_2213.t1-p1 / transcript=Cvel_2213.t1 / gene=Cvel_2213 / organism=Chromera_velia_CCMP2878 / gene_product=hypothetical protein / transcript_product=hypothetical protein / location=Cvel_scaffold85:80807-81349(-) / protein_length=181 / sequence_SO=supercontig / SO=protein_coding / is_pseudo=false
MSQSDLEKLKRIVCANNALGIRLFWKFSSLSKDQLKLRDDTSENGIGGVLNGLCLTPLSERKAVRSLLFDSADRDNAAALKQLLAVEGVDGLSPGLLSRAMTAGAVSCVRLLTERGQVSSFGRCSTEFSSDSVRKVSVETLKMLFESGTLNPNSWVVSEMIFDPDFDEGQFSLNDFRFRLC